MALVEKALQDLDESDLHGLISSGVPEGPRFEYKEANYGSADADKKEFLKDLTSFANTFGGHLILGVREAAGVAVGIAPLSGDADADLLRLESLARDGVEPRIAGVSMRSVPISGGGYVIIARVPRSWHAPHRVSYKGSARFYGRTSAGVYELSVDELRAKFNSAVTAIDRARAFRAERLGLLAADEGVVPLALDGGRLILHVYPLSTTGEAIVDLPRVDKLGGQLPPMSATGWSPEFNFDGYANVGSGSPSRGYTQLFRDGSIEATRIRVVADRDGIMRIPAKSIGDVVVTSVKKFIPLLEQLSVPAPLLVMLTLQGVKGAHLGYSESQWMDDPATIRRDELQLPPIVVGEYSTPEAYERALKPAFDALWNAGGLAECTYFNCDGQWAPHD